MAADKLIDSTNSAEIYDELSTEVASMYSRTDDELAELVEDVAVHEAPEAMVSGGQSVRVPVGDPCVELEVDVELQVVDNQS